jgi:hypothetical protein
MSERRRRRSRDVALVAVPVLAIAFTGCGGNDTAYCVDKSDRIIENRYCDNTTSGSYFWYYGGRGSNFSPGQRLTGGDRVPTSNIAENARRGGFGSGAKAGGVGRSVASHSSGGG